MELYKYIQHKPDVPLLGMSSASKNNTARGESEKGLSVYK